MKKIFIIIFAMITVLAFSPVDSAYADPSRGHGKEKHHNKEKHHKKDKHKSKIKHHNDDDVVKIIINDQDRVYISNYIGNDFRENCPPGLAKKHNGCRPPGHAKRYIVGQPLGETLIYEEVPAILISHLHPVPVGYRYVMVDKDVLLISEASKKVIDAVTLLSAVGH